MRPGAKRTTTGADRRRVHQDWLDLVEVNGPFLSLPVLLKHWPDLEAVDTRTRDRLRREHADWLSGAGRDPWIGFVLRELLGWGDDVGFAGAAEHDLGYLAMDVAAHETTVGPSFALLEPGSKDPLLLGLVSDGPPTRRVAGSSWSATPADRLALLCRHHGVELGLATDGRWWTLVWAPRGGVTTTVTFDAVDWPAAAERVVVRAFCSLLERRRFLAVPEEARLPALLRESLDQQEDLTERLGVQVRQAVEMLVAAVSRADVHARDRGGTGLGEVSAHDVYRGAVSVMMRVVFLLFAEERRLLPSDNELYAEAYSVSRLYEQLEQRVRDAGGNAGELEHTHRAWHRLLALFTAVYSGVDHPDLELAAHDGSLFDPAAFPWLAEGLDGRPLPVDDRTVLQMLRAVQHVTIGRELRKVTFRALDVEQIGYVYEGLLDHDGYRAAQAMVGLIGSKEGSEAEVPLAELEELAAAHPAADELAGELATRYKDAKIGTANVLTKKLQPLDDEERAVAETKLYAVAKDHDLVRRLLPFYRIIRRDLRDDPLVFLPGALYMTESALRKNTGTHYTPRDLAEKIAEGALEPLVYRPGPLETADQSQWKLRSAEEILSLKVADIAMGSAAFLVAACRYLANRLVEAWAEEGDEDARAYRDDTSDADVAIDAEADPLVVEARRQIIEHCLYGVDINPMAVEMAKLSLWLVSMDSGRPFTFLDDRLMAGDSLLGITSLDQLEVMDLDAKRGRKIHERALLDFTTGVRSLVDEVAQERRQLADIGDSSFTALEEKRRLLAGAKEKTARAALFADLASGAALATAGKSESDQRQQVIQAADYARRVDEDTLDAEEKAREAARSWLRTDLPNDGFEREPLHWPLVFPEVFDAAREAGAGFDAVIGNPPFLGGQKLTGSLGRAYREYLVNRLGLGARGSADLIAYFALRAHALLNSGGQTGLIATNTLAQGDTREVGLDQLTANNVTIRQAIKSAPWPSKSAVLEYAAVWGSRAELSDNAQRIADDVVVRGITSSLDPASRVSGRPYRLAENMGISFQGSNILGLGFTMPPEHAQRLIEKDPRNKDVLFPYLNGQDLNSRPDCSGGRWVINFHDWQEERAKNYPEPYAQVLRDVKPQRAGDNRKVYREYWWQYAEKRPAMLDAISGLDRAIVLTLVSKVVMPVMVPTGQVFAHKLGVFAADDTGTLALLSSAPHYWWAINRSSTMKADLNYSPSDVFETLARPETTEEMRDLGDCLDTFRRDLMLSRQSGLTKTYNMVHDPKNRDTDIVELREIHRAIDEAVVRAYGWEDLLAQGLGHDFHETRQGTRYTIGPAVRIEILDRLLELNHARYDVEVEQGLHEKSNKKGTAPDALF
ncbi:Eco57I restriction-modification methylase domain-containing protein [Salinactinospora qingdaonensis]|uniref:site-specific DNA-methyltransferase (adenine-specific) n=1 Tax=Salinactinospora qingdaonensis TaxID=702744 RepID=A0ABP7G6R6_9ACTN